MDRGDTIAAVSTAPGRGGVAVIRVSGPDAFEVARRVTGREPRPGRVAFTAFFAPDGADGGRRAIDSGLLLAFKSPRSYTGEDVVEFQCHGGFVTPRRVLESALASGARLARRGEFTERAFLNGRLSFSQAEAVIDLIDARTARAADAALGELSPGAAAAPGATPLASRLAALYGSIVELAADIEHSLDVDEGELADGFAAGVAKRLAENIESVRGAVRRLREKRMLRDGSLVVLAGPPNAGKSSLLNALAGEDRAIVSATPGTTRDAIEAWTDIGGWPVRLVDTAGLRDGDGVGDIEAEGIRRAAALASRADVVVWLDDGREGAKPPPGRGEIAVSSKCDLRRGPGLNVSSATGEGLDALRSAIVARLEALAESEPEPDEDETAISALLETERILSGAAATFAAAGDLVLLGNALRSASEKTGLLIGASYTEDMLSRLFDRFCVGK